MRTSFMEHQSMKNRGVAMDHKIKPIKGSVMYGIEDLEQEYAIAKWSRTQRERRGRVVVSNVRRQEWSRILLRYC